MPARAQRRPAPAARSGRKTRRTASARRGPATSQAGSSGPLSGKDANVVEEDLAEEDDPGPASERPRDENEGHWQFGKLGFLIPAEFDKLDSPIDEHQRENQDEQARDDLQRRVAAQPELRPDVDLEMGTLLNGDHRAEHDHPNEEKARQLLGPDV